MLQDVYDAGGQGLLYARYDGSIAKALIALYPDYKQLCRDFVMNCMRDLNLVNLEDVLNVDKSYFKAKSPQLLRQHNNSVVTRMSLDKSDVACSGIQLFS